MKYFILGRYDELSEGIMKRFGDQLDGKYEKSEVAKVSKGTFIVHTIKDVDYVCWSLKDLEQYINFKEDNILDTLTLLGRVRGIFPIIDVESNEDE